MYIFGVYECVFSVVAVDLQPAVCKGLKQTIIQSSWTRRTEEAARIDDATEPNTLYSGAIISFVDYSSTFFSYFIRLNHHTVFNFIWRPFFSAHAKAVTGGAIRLAESGEVKDGSCASVFGFFMSFFSFVLTRHENRAHCLVWRVFASLKKKNWALFDCDGARHLLSHGRLEVIFSSTRFYYHTWFGTKTGVMPVEGIVGYVWNGQNYNNNSTINIFDISDVALERRNLTSSRASGQSSTAKYTFQKLQIITISYSLS